MLPAVYKSQSAGSDNDTGGQHTTLTGQLPNDVDRCAHRGAVVECLRILSAEYGASERHALPPLYLPACCLLRPGLQSQKPSLPALPSTGISSHRKRRNSAQATTARATAR